MNELKITFISEIFSAYVKQHKVVFFWLEHIVTVHKCVSNFLERETGTFFCFSSWIPINVKLEGKNVIQN